MTQLTGKGTKVFIDDKDFSAEGRSIDMSIDIASIDSTTFSSQWKQSIQGMPEVKVDYKGIWEKSTTGMDYFITSNLTTLAKGITVCPGEPVAGGVAFNGQVRSVTKPITIPVDNIIAMDASFTLDAFGRAKLIEYEGTAVGAQEGTGVDLGEPLSGYSARSTDKWVTTIHIFEFNGSGTFQVALQESSDDGSADSYAAVASGTLAISGGTAGSFCNIDGPRERWARVKTTVQSGNATCKFAVAVAVMPK